MNSFTKSLIVTLSLFIAVAFAFSQDTVTTPIKQLGYGPKTGTAMSPDGKTFLTSSGDGNVRLWDIASETVLKTFAGHTTSVSSVAFSPDGKTFITGSGDGTTKLWDISSIGIKNQQLHHSKISRTTLSVPNNRLLICTSTHPFLSADLIVYNITGKVITRIRINQQFPGKTTVALKNPLPAGYFLFRIISPHDKKLLASGGFLVM